MLIKSYCKCSNIISSYNPIRQTIPVVYNALDLRISYLQQNFWRRNSLPLVICVSDISKAGAIVLSYFPETILYISIMSPLICL